MVKLLSPQETLVDEDDGLEMQSSQQENEPSSRQGQSSPAPTERFFNPSILDLLPETQSALHVSKPVGAESCSSSHYDVSQLTISDVEIASQDPVDDPGDWEDVEDVENVEDELPPSAGSSFSTYPACLVPSTAALQDEGFDSPISNRPVVSVSRDSSGNDLDLDLELIALIKDNWTLQERLESKRC